MPNFNQNQDFPSKTVDRSSPANAGDVCSILGPETPHRPWSKWSPCATATGACAFWGLGVTATEAHEPESEHSTHCTWCLEPTPCNQRGVPALCNYRRPVSGLQFPQDSPGSRTPQSHRFCQGSEEGKNERCKCDGAGSAGCLMNPRRGSAREVQRGGQERQPHQPGMDCCIGVLMRT